MARIFYFKLDFFWAWMGYESTNRLKYSLLAWYVHSSTERKNIINVSLLSFELFCFYHIRPTYKYIGVSRKCNFINLWDLQIFSDIFKYIKPSRHKSCHKGKAHICCTHTQQGNIKKFDLDEMT